jgi:hypothetical protein
MSGDKGPSLVHSLAGMAYVVGMITCLVVLWVYGLPLLGGTIFSDLSLIIYAVVALGFLTLADRIANMFPRR